VGVTTTSPAPSSGAPSKGPHGAGRAEIAARTLRNDRWWIPPLTTAVGLIAWVTYATVRVFLQKDYFVGAHHYLTPFYSPCISKGCVPEASEFGRFLPDVWWLPYAAATLPFLLLFRMTCYYYRKAYYRAFWLSPPACAVAEPHTKYTGETRFPLLGQNLHRYFFYAAGIISLINTWDAIKAFENADGGFGLGLGNIVLWVNVIMLWAYTLSCHSCRHIVGGRMRNFSKHPLRYRAWTFISKLNAKHMQLAWTTLATLMLTDGYIALVASGTFSDPRILH
jgi:hypothetical protein